MNITILYGGTSTEHKISIQTGLAIAEAIKDRYNLDMINLNTEIYNAPYLLLDTDLVINALHGGDGEDGSIQSFLDLHHIPYTGSGAKACKIAMDKNITKLIAKSVGVPTPNWVLLKRNVNNGMQLQDNDSPKFSYPYVVKPADEGSTFGLTIVNEESELNDAISLAAEFSNEILIEEFISGRELTVGILGNKPLPIVEIHPWQIGDHLVMVERSYDHVRMVTYAGLRVEVDVSRAFEHESRHLVGKAAPFDDRDQLR